MLSTVFTDQDGRETPDQLEITAERTHLAAKFVAGTLRQPIISDGARVVDHAEALERDSERPVHIVKDCSGWNWAE